MTEQQLPHYMQKANKIIEILQAEPEQTWKKTQKELSIQANISQPELSSIVRLLIDNRKIVKGDPIPGVRGKNNRLVLVDPVFFTEPVRRVAATTETVLHPRDRILTEEEKINGAIDLRNLNAQEIGYAIVSVIENSFLEKENHERIREEQSARLREYREQLARERAMRTQLAEERDELETQLHEVRTQLNVALGKGKY